jgi:SAM-dependent methyltransferase
VTTLIWVAWGVGAALLAVTALILLIGAPYVPTIKRARQDALDLLDLKPGQLVLDLGCGDGRFLISAAKRGLRAEGWELNPLLAAYAWLATRRYRQQIKVHWGNFWKADLSRADGVFVFLLDRFMERLDQKIKKDTKSRGLKLASHAFKVPGKKPAASKGAVFLYFYPPLARGR